MIMGSDNPDRARFVTLNTPVEAIGNIMAVTPTYFGFEVKLSRFSQSRLCIISINQQLPDIWTPLVDDNIAWYDMLLQEL